VIERPAVAIVIPTASRHLYVVKETDAPGFAIEHDFDLTGAVAQGDSIISACPAAVTPKAG